MTNSGLISIWIPSYNRPEYLRDLLKSILKQTYSNFEVIIYDDESPRIDEIREIVSQMADQRIRLFEWKNTWFIKNWNRTLRECKWKYIKISWDDDILLEDCLQEQLNVLESDPTIGFTCSNYYTINANGNTINNTIFNENSYRIFSSDTKEQGKDFIKNYFLWNRKVWLPTAILFRGDIIPNIWYFDESIWSPVDIDYWIRIAKEYNFYYLDKTLLKLRWHNNLSKQLAKKIVLYENLIQLLQNHFYFIKTDLTFWEKVKIWILHLYMSLNYFNIKNLPRLLKDYFVTFKIIFLISK